MRDKSGAFVEPWWKGDFPPPYNRYANQATAARLYIEQKGLCAICGQGEKKRALSLDHDHKTGKNRQLLCQRCNTALGMIKEKESVALALCKYIRKHKK